MQFPDSLTMSFGSFNPIKCVNIAVTFCLAVPCSCEVKMRKSGCPTFPAHPSPCWVQPPNPDTLYFHCYLWAWPVCRDKHRKFVASFWLCFVRHEADSHAGWGVLIWVASQTGTGYCSTPPPAAAAKTCVPITLLGHSQSTLSHHRGHTLLGACLCV